MFKEKIFNKVLSKSNSFNFYKNYYYKSQKNNKKIVRWSYIFDKISHNKKMFNATMDGVFENLNNGNKTMKYCSICGYKTPTFIAGGPKFRKNARCPVCNSLERHRFLYFFIKNKLDLTTNLKLLHFAPEKSFYDIFESLNNIEYYTADIEKSARVKEVMDIQNIPYDNDYFDLVICNHVLEHVPNDKKAMSELYRTIKPATNQSGVLIMVPIDFNRKITLEKEEYNTPELREKYYGQHDHVRMYGLDFKDKLESVGFNVEIFDYHWPLIKNPVKYGFNKGDIIFYCTKE